MQKELREFQPKLKNGVQIENIFLTQVFHHFSPTLHNRGKNTFFIFRRYFLHKTQVTIQKTEIEK